MPIQIAERADVANIRDDDAVSRRMQLDHSPDLVLTDVKIGFDNVLARDQDPAAGLVGLVVGNLGRKHDRLVRADTALGAIA
ncbi:MAG: hypothetical protein AB7E81_25020 [Hyphomicrobiaceae bacterium]